MTPNTLLFVLLALAVVALRWGMSHKGADQLDSIRAALENGAMLVDVRSSGEFASGHLDGAINIPVGELERRTDELGNTDALIVLYCASGARSASARRALAGRGFTNVLDLGSIRNGSSL